jgi:thiol:disulfide interchange protein DsbA
MSIRSIASRSPASGMCAAAAVLLGLALTGCGQKQDAAPAPAAQTVAPAAPAVAAPEPTAEPSTPAVATEEVQQAPAGESVSDASTSSLSPIASAVAQNAPAAATGTPIPAKWQAGKHYTTLMPAQPTSTGPDKVEVVEVFWYGCGHCFHLDPMLESWKTKGKPANAEFSRVPVMWNEITKAHARLFYTLEALGKLDELHTTVFREIHVKGNTLADRDPAKTEQIHREFLKQHGVSAADFDRTYRSFAVENKLARADQLTKRYRVTGVPLMVVNGKYTTDVGMAGGEPAMLTLLTDLAASERRR